MSINLGSVVNEIVEGWIELASVGNVELVELFINEIVFRVLFNIGLEVVTVLLLLLGETSKEEGVVIDPTLLLALIHALFTSLVIVGVGELASMELLYAVEMAVEYSDGLFDFHPRLVVVAAIGNW